MNNTVRDWHPLLAPFDKEETLATAIAIEELTQEATISQLFLDEAVQLLSSIGKPGTALLVASVACRQGLPALDTYWWAVEEVCGRALVLPDPNTAFGEADLRNTARVALALRALLGFLEPTCDSLSDRGVASIAGVELLIRMFMPGHGVNSSLKQLTSTIGKEFKAIAEELHGVLGEQVRKSMGTASTHDLEQSRRRLQQLLSELDGEIKVRHTRGLQLLNRIQVDINQRVFRPFLDSVAANDTLSENVARDIGRLDPEELVDRHPLQLMMPARRRVTGSARTDTVRQYQSIVDKLKEASHLRLAIQSVSQAAQRPLRSSVEAELSRLVDCIGTKNLSPDRWLFVRLLRGETLLASSHVPLPDFSLLSQGVEGSVVTAAVFALVEPTTLALCARELVAFDGTFERTKALLSAIASVTDDSRGAIQQMNVDNILSDLYAEKMYFESRIWASVVTRITDDQTDISDRVDERIRIARREMLVGIEKLTRRWILENCDDDARQSFDRHLDAARQFIAAGLFRRAAEQLNLAEVLIQEEERQRDTRLRLAISAISDRALRMRDRLSEVGDLPLLRSILAALDQCDEMLGADYPSTEAAHAILDLSELAIAGDPGALSQIAVRFQPTVAAQNTRDAIEEDAAVPESQQHELDEEESEDIVADFDADEARRSATPGIPTQQPDPGKSRASLTAVSGRSSEMVSSNQAAYADRLFRNGEHARSAGNTYAAERFFREALRVNPDSRRALSQLAIVLAHLERYAESEVLLTQGIDRFPSHFAFHHELINQYITQGKFSRARALAERGLNACTTPDEEVGFLNQLAQVERLSGNTSSAISHLTRLVRLRPHVPDYRKRIEQYRSQPLLTPGVTIEVAEDEIAWTTVSEELEISEFLEGELRRDHTKVTPDFLEREGPEKASDTAFRLAQSAIADPNPRQTSAEAENLRTAAKLLIEIRERCPDFDYIQYARGRYGLNSSSMVHKTHDETLRRYLSFFASRMGDFHLRHMRLQAAKAYYLEHFRVAGHIKQFSLYSAESFLRACKMESEDWRRKAREIVGLRARERLTRAPEEFVVLFCLAIQRVFAGDWNATNGTELLWAFLDICLVCSPARTALVRLAARRGHLVAEVTGQLQRCKALGIEQSDPVAWVNRVLEHREETRRRMVHELEYLRETLIDRREYGEAVNAVSTVRGFTSNEVDNRALEQLQELLRLAERYKAANRFTDKRYLASQLQLRIGELRDYIDREPTEIGRNHVQKMLFRLHRDVEIAFEEYKQRCQPSLTLQVIKSHIISDCLVRCDVQIVNEGLSPAHEVAISFCQTDESSEGIGETQQSLVNPGQLNVVVQKVDLNVMLLPTHEATEVVARGTFQDSDGREYRIPVQTLRVSVATNGVFIPIANPYVTGRIVKDSHLFKGRDREIGDVLAEVANPTVPGAVVMYGQKRSGKSSILYWIAKRAPQWIIPVEIKLQDMFADDEVLTNLLYLMAEAISDQALEHRAIELPRIDDDELFRAHVPTLVFKRFLLEINRALGSNRRLLLLFDEFTDLSARIDQGVIERGFLRFLKSVIEQGMFSCVICGIDSMPKVIKTYSNDFAIANSRTIGYLERTSAEQLIVDPIRLADTKKSRFTPSAVEAIVDLTAGSPYYIQLLCSRLVDYLNAERNPDPTITKADVDQTVREIVQGRALVNPWSCFDNLCRYKENPERDTRETIVEGFILYLVADGMRNSEYVGHSAIVQRVNGLTELDEVENTINDLVEREVLVLSPGTPIRQYRIKVALFYQWLVANRPMDDEAFGAFRRKLEVAGR